MNKSIEKRLLYSFTVIAAIVLICVSLGLSYMINDYFWGQRKRELINDGNQIANMIVTRFEPGDREGIERYLRSVDHFLRARIWLIDADGRLLASSLPPYPPVGEQHEQQHDRSEGEKHQMRQGQGHMQRRNASTNTNVKMQNENVKKAYDTAGLQIRDMVKDVLTERQAKTIRSFHPYFEDNVIAVGIPIKNENGVVISALLLTAPVRNAQSFLTNIYYYIAGVGFLAIVLSWLLAKLLSRRLVQPLIDMRESAAAMARGDYTGRVAVQGGDEVADLGRSLNMLAEDLTAFVDKTERMEQLRRDFVANVSHELRTPITIIRGYNEAMLDGTITDSKTIDRYRSLIRDETIRLEGLVRELLDISRLQARTETSFERVPLDAITRDIAEKLMVKANERDVKITVSAEENTFVNAVGDRLVQLVMILTDNAVKYSKQGGNVLLSVKKLPDNQVELMVEDDGVGIAEEDQPLVWERFYKADKSHSKAVGGTGLGLAIAKEIIEMHGARLSLESELGKGTRIKVTFFVADGLAG